MLPLFSREGVGHAVWRDTSSYPCAFFQEFFFGLIEGYRVMISPVEHPSCVIVSCHVAKFALKMSLTDGRLFGQVESLSMNLLPDCLLDRVLGTMFCHCAVTRSSLHGSYTPPFLFCYREVSSSPVEQTFSPVKCG